VLKNKKRRKAGGKKLHYVFSKKRSTGCREGEVKFNVIKQSRDRTEPGKGGIGQRKRTDYVYQPRRREKE